MPENLNEQTLERTLSLLREAMDRGEPIRQRIIGLRRTVDGQILSFITEKEKGDGGNI